jgi:hypothetical protein
MQELAQLDGALLSPEEAADALAAGDRRVFAHTYAYRQRLKR